MKTHDTPVRVLRVITRLNVGGPSRQVAVLGASLTSRGYRTTVVAGTPAPEEGDMTETLRALGIAVHRVRSLSNRLNPLADLWAFAALLRLMLRTRPHVVHAHQFKARLLGGLAAKLAGVPVIVETFHGSLFDGYFGPVRRRVVLAIERFIGRRVAHRVVAISAAGRDELLARRVCPAERLTVIPLGLDLARFRDADAHREAARAELRAPADAVVVLAVGRLVPIKGHEVLLQAFALLVRSSPVPVILALAGDGPLRPRLEASARALGIADRVTFFGTVEAIHCLYGAADIVALASHNEGTPVTLIEALVAGRPVVATNVGGVAAVVTDGVNGVLVPPGDPTALARALGRLAADPRERARLAGAARGGGVAERFAATRLVGDVDRLYHEALGIAPGPVLPVAGSEGA